MQCHNLIRAHCIFKIIDDDDWLNNWLIVEMMLKLQVAVNFPEVLPSWCQPSRFLQIQRMFDGGSYLEHRILQCTESHPLNHAFRYDVELVFVYEAELVKHMHI